MTIRCSTSTLIPKHSSSAVTQPDRLACPVPPEVLQGPGSARWGRPGVGTTGELPNGEVYGGGLAELERLADPRAANAGDVDRLRNRRFVVERRAGCTARCASPRSTWFSDLSRRGAARSIVPARSGPRRGAASAAVPPVPCVALLSRLGPAVAGRVREARGARKLRAPRARSLRVPIGALVVTPTVRRSPALWRARSCRLLRP